jgi:hypothetical protein
MLTVFFISKIAFIAAVLYAAFLTANVAHIKAA